MTTGLLAEIAGARALAVATGRADLAARLDAAAEVLGAGAVPVVVVGEYKHGKSSLVNALLRTDVLPVDADVVTTVATTLSYGTRPSAHVRDENGVDTEVGLDELKRRLVSPGAHSAGVRLDRRLLGTGLSLVDTPGVGGLDSASGNLTLAALPPGGAALFVTSAAQELTAPEIDFLRRVTVICTRVFCVVTKIDLYAEWRRIVATDESHLRAAGIDVPVIAVSSFLRDRAQAQGSTALNDESGFPRLVADLRDDVVGAAAADREASARAELDHALGQLRSLAAATRLAAAQPERAADLADEYASRARRGATLAGGGNWQTVLGDGIQDLAADVEHDLRERLRHLVRHGEELIDGSDPRDSWPDLQAWAARTATAAAVDNLLLLATRTDALAASVAERFGLEFAGLDADLTAPTIGGVEDVTFQKAGLQQVLGAFTAARVAYGGFVLLGAAGALVNLAVAAPIGLLAGVFLGRRLIKGERERQLGQRRQQAKAALRRYADDAGFQLGRQSREAVRRTQRRLRDEFTARAQEASRAAAATAAAVREIAALPAAERAERTRWADDLA